jgi:hypothetical protein
MCFRCGVAAERNMTTFFFLTFAVGGGYCVVPAFIRSTGSTTALLRTTPSGQLPEVVTMTTKSDVRMSGGSRVVSFRKQEVCCVCRIQPLDLAQNCLNPVHTSSHPLSLLLRVNYIDSVHSVRHIMPSVNITIEFSCNVMKDI